MGTGFSQQQVTSAAKFAVDHKEEVYAAGRFAYQHQEEIAGVAKFGQNLMGDTNPYNQQQPHSQGPPQDFLK